MAKRNSIGSMKIKDVILVDSSFTPENMRDLARLLGRPVIQVERLGSIKSLTSKELRKIAGIKRLTVSETVPRETL